MIEIIKNTLRKRLNELNIKNKGIYGHGTYHNVYQSKNHPDRVYKVGSQSVVNSWLEIFKSHPNLFPIVYNTGELTLKDKNKKAYFVEIEKLNTAPVEKDWNEIYKTITSLDSYDDEFFWTNSEILFLDIIDMPEYINQILPELKRKYPKVYEDFTGWVNLINNVYNVIPGRLDIHLGNFGYDKEGNKKCLDI